MAGKNTPAPFSWYNCLSYGVYRVAELLPFEFSQYINFCLKRLKYDHKIVVFIALLPKINVLKFLNWSIFSTLKCPLHNNAFGRHLTYFHRVGHNMWNGPV